MSKTLYTIAAIAAFSMATFAQARDLVPMPALLKPPPTTSALPAGDTKALLPPGNYVLRITFKQDTLEQPAIISRSGNGVNTIVAGSDSLNGTLNRAGQLQLAGGSSNDRLELTGPVQNHSASGRALLVRGANRMIGTFALEPMTSASLKMKEYQAPGTPKKDECGFFCKLGKAWDSLTNWAG